MLLSNFWDLSTKARFGNAWELLMFKIKSIAARLILAIALTVAVACAILSGFSITQQRALTRLALDQQLKLQYDSVIAAIDYEGRSALAVSAAIAALPSSPICRVIPA